MRAGGALSPMRVERPFEPAGPLSHGEDVWRRPGARVGVLRDRGLAVDVERLERVERDQDVAERRVDLAVREAAAQRVQDRRRVHLFELDEIDRRLVLERLEVRDAKALVGGHGHHRAAIARHAHELALGRARELAACDETVALVGQPPPARGTRHLNLPAPSAWELKLSLYYPYAIVPEASEGLVCNY